MAERPWDASGGQALGDDPRVDATAVQTVGTKGHDGLVVALVTEAAT